MLSRRSDAFPDNALIRQQAEELRALELMPLGDFLKTYARLPAKNLRVRLEGDPPPAGLADSLTVGGGDCLMSTPIADQSDADVARMLRTAADQQCEAALEARWRGIGAPQDAIDEGRQCVFNLRAAADYHERQAARRRRLNA